MAGVRIDDGALSATYRFTDIPKNRWPELVREKRDFLATKIKYDCRCLIEFCEEANEAWETLEYTSAADMIRNGYELDPQQIELAIAWLKINEPQAAIGIEDVSQKIEKAVANKEKQQGKRNDLLPDNIRKSSGGTDTDYTLRRLARDAPEYLDRIESGELSVNAAAIQAGIRKKPTHAEICIRAFTKADNRLDTLRAILSNLSDCEREIAKEWMTTPKPS